MSGVVFAFRQFEYYLIPRRLPHAQLLVHPVVAREHLLHPAGEARTGEHGVDRDVGDLR